MFSAKYKQEMIVVNKPGAGGALAWSQMNSMPGDGHTIVGVNLPHIVLQPLEAGTQFKTEDITPVYFFHYTPDAIIVAADSPFKTFADLVKCGAREARVGHDRRVGHQHRQSRRAGAPGSRAEHRTTYVPFKGTGDLVSSVLGGHVAAAMSYSTLAIQQKGKMRMLAVATEKRLPQFPDVPTFKELGMNWVDGAYRGIARTEVDAARGAQAGVRHDGRDQQGSRVASKKMTDDGFEVTDIALEMIPAFMKERKPQYLQSAKTLGLVK